MAAATAVGSAALGIASPASAHAAPGSSGPVVSITFDDSTADQLAAADVLERLGLRATFFVISGHIDEPGYFTRDDLDRVARQGHEIGGHTVLHPRLAEVSADEARREICLDRTNLTEWGHEPRVLAYPFSSTAPSVEDSARSCGYDAARLVGGLAARDSCVACDKTEAMPLQDPFSARSPGQFDPTWTLPEMQTLVLDAERTGGGWLPLVFHHICDACEDNAVGLTQFSAFADWLAARQAAGTLTVRTASEALGLAALPLRETPDVPFGAPPSSPVNPTLEDRGPDGRPVCWTFAPSGVNTATVAAAPGRGGGSGAERITVTEYRSGDAKLLPTMDLGDCAPAASEGHRYRLATGFQSDAPVQYALFVRDFHGSWSYWTSSPFFAASERWDEARWVTPETPPGTTALSFGLALTGVGSLTVDSTTMTPTVDPFPPLSGPRALAIAAISGAAALVLATIGLWVRRARRTAH
ncbi:Polysaccharide deacetylase [Pseudonocardia oroxyli]|uniref:Polysaccharide deacetylase n=2 Tax=Pseudonocardia oroxyli TaxID=366584 RepID=A0A1G7Z7S1_PSEOR|nr:Polysaccharide deacetylase [Pseudonocardia oroxyli]